MKLTIFSSIYVWCGSSSSNHISRIWSHGTGDIMGKAFLYTLCLIWDSYNSFDATVRRQQNHGMDYSDDQTVRSKGLQSRDGECWDKKRCHRFLFVVAYNTASSNGICAHWNRLGLPWFRLLLFYNFLYNRIWRSCSECSPSWWRRPNTGIASPRLFYYVFTD